MQISGINHVSFIVSNLQESLRFYHELLGLQIDNTRPDLGYPGAWLKIGSNALHLLVLPNPDPISDRPSHGGHDRHLAINITDLDSLMSKLQQFEIDFTPSASGRRALFCRDPDGNALEFIEIKSERQ